MSRCSKDRPGGRWQGRPGRFGWLVIGGLLGSSLALAGAKLRADGLLTLKVDSENLRDAPNGSKIGSLVKGTEVEKTGQDGKWLRVRLEAWVWGPSLDGFEEEKVAVAASGPEDKPPPLLAHFPLVKRLVNDDYGTFYGLHLDGDFDRIRLRWRVGNIGPEALERRQLALHRHLLEVLDGKIDFAEIQLESNRPDGTGPVGASLARATAADLRGLKAKDLEGWRAVVRRSVDGGQTWSP